MADTSPKPGTKARDQKKAATRAAVLAAAIEVFAKGSVAGTPVEAIAQAAGVSKATMFFHFGSRTELLEAVADEIYRYGVEHIWRAQQGGLLAFLRAYLASQRAPETRVLWEIGDELTVNGRPGPDLAYLHLIAEIEGHLIDNGIDDTMRTTLARVLAAGVLFVARRIVLGEADEQEAERFVDDVEAVLAPWQP